MLTTNGGKALEISPGYDRVRDHTAPVVNRRIDERVRGAVGPLLESDDLEAVFRRLDEVDREWDIDRALMANFVMLGGASFLLGLRKSRGWLYAFGAQMGFLLMHATLGWCPPTSLFRRLGFRTQKEIAVERWALLEHLKGLRQHTA